MTHLSRRNILTAGGLAGLSAAFALAGCTDGSSSSSASGGGGDIEVFFNMTSGSPVVDVTKKIIEDFKTKTGVTVNATYDQAGYEDAIKVRLASGDIPDVFATHGWSVMRYSEFLEPLNERPWEQYVNSGLDSSMRDAEGLIYAVPIQYTVAGIGVNFDVLEQAGVSADSITTWEEFNAAADKIAAAGAAVIESSGKDGLAGNVVNFVCSGAFSEEELQAFKDGNFQSDAYMKVLDLIGGWADKGWFNKDYASASTDDVSRAMAEGTAAFMLDQPDQLNTALSYKSDANIGFIPYPTWEGDRYLVGGEGIQAYGVARSSANKEAALDFIDFLAEPENAKAIAEASGSYSGLTNVSVDLGVLSPSYEKWMEEEKMPTLPFFDRAYLPSGMFDTMKASTDGVITGQTSTDDALKQMESQFASLYTQG